MSKQLKIVRATYYPPASIFKIPKTLNLEDKTVVKGYWVKYDTLYIEFVDTTRETLAIEPYLFASEAQDYKWPQKLEIVDADEEGVEDDEDEEECEKCPHPKVDEEDNLCHDCYHKTCEKGECYCGC